MAAGKFQCAPDVLWVILQTHIVPAAIFPSSERIYPRPADQALHWRSNGATLRYLEGRWPPVPATRPKALFASLFAKNAVFEAEARMTQEHHKEQTPKIKAGPRAIALVGPHGGGKTTLLESIAVITGAIQRKGAVANGSSLGDHSPESRARQMSVEMNVLTTQYMD